jgi:DNA-directed RNA polymerase subunit RPC12/RpoP
MLRQDLINVGDIDVDLGVTIAKLDRLSDPERRPSGEHPLPLRLGPVQIRDDLIATLLAWAQHTATRHGHTLPVLFRRQPAQLAGWLHTYRLVDDPDAGDMCAEIGYAVVRARRAADHPPDMLYAGPCEDCGADLYAHQRAPQIECKDCGAEYPVEARRKWLLEQVDDQLLTATELSRALPGLIRRPLTSAMIRGLAHRGRLTAHPPLPKKPHDPVYRLGDLLDLLPSLDERSGRPMAC